jgi:hypothetical protein
MAIIMEANYSKKLGLPGYSSHQFAVTLKLELAELNQLPAECARLYSLLQGCVDKEIQKPGYLPGNGLSRQSAPASGNGNTQVSPVKGNGRQNGAWACLPAQRDLLLSIVEQHRLDKKTVEAFSRQHFAKSVRALNNVETSALINELLLQLNGQDDRRATSANLDPEIPSLFGDKATGRAGD